LAVVSRSPRPVEDLYPLKLSNRRVVNLSLSAFRPPGALTGTRTSALTGLVAWIMAEEANRVWVVFGSRHRPGEAHESREQGDHRCRRRRSASFYRVVSAEETGDPRGARERIPVPDRTIRVRRRALAAGKDVVGDTEEVRLLLHLQPCSIQSFRRC
jgi:hypothetical protein